MSVALRKGSEPKTFISRAESHEVGGEGQCESDGEGEGGGGVDGRFSNEKGGGEAEGFSLSVMTKQYRGYSKGCKFNCVLAGSVQDKL